MEILQFKDNKTVPDVIHLYSNSIKTCSVPLVIDNGSYNCRVGWATSDSPQLSFKNVIAKPRKERGKKDGETQVGNNITNIEAVRFQLKTQFDRNVVTHYEVQEQILNYVFTHLGIDTEGSVNHPIIMTEAFLNPNYCRMLMSELLFECYGVPGVMFGVDSLLSYHKDCNKDPLRTGLVVCCGYHTTHVIPVINGRADAHHARRMDIGGSHMISYLHKLLQLKYPAHFAAITLSRAEELLHQHCNIVEDYSSELNSWSDGDFYDRNVLCIQLPYSAGSSGSLGLTPEQQRERRRELARRLTEINARKREEKLAEDEEQLNQLLAIQDLQEEGEETEFQNALKDFGLGSGDELPKIIGQIQVRIEKTRQKIVAANTTEDPMSEEPKQKIIKQFQTPKDEEDFKSWIADVRKKREELLEKRLSRRQRRQEMAKRRTPASVERMRLINQLARNEKRDDDFGMRDEDWDVYKAINKGGDSDSEGEAEKLMELEQVLRAHDPGFSANGEANSGAEEAGEAHRLHVGVERIRAPEVLFQPSLIGSHQAGLADTIDYVLKSYDADTASILASDIYLTGGTSRIPGLKERLTREITALRPFRSHLSIRLSSSPSINAWLAARDLARDSRILEQCLVTKQEYHEKGGEYIKDHSISNPYFPSPLPLSVMETMPNNSISNQEDIEIDIV
ncbi:hypothetical protein AAG570_006285 [Ranatra chinensis]|uniref:Actin-related protein 5 n=1 Tax=Ranatra chinensis TaxID=642074 RepID=A0ABD0YTI0_9HEMI